MISGRPSRCAPSTVADQGVLLVGHGTEEPHGQAEFFELSRLVQGLLPRWRVEPAFLELANPTIKDGLRRLVAAGIHQVAAAPVLLFAAGHAKRDIPAALQAAAQQHPEVTIRQTRHLGCHVRMLELSHERFEQSRDETVSTGDTALVFVGRGSRDAQALAETRRFLELRCRQSAVAHAAACFLAMAQPRLPETLRRVASLGFRQIVIQPHLLFAGKLLERLHHEVAESARRFPDASWRVAAPLGPRRAVAEAISDHVLQAAWSRQPAAPLPIVETAK